VVGLPKADGHARLHREPDVLAEAAIHNKIEKSNQGKSEAD
jgi:hypothetical protein